jgi:uncharacterized protein (DUF2141 family)
MTIPSHRPRRTQKSTAALVLLLALSLGAPTMADAATLTVTFNGIKILTGAVMVSLSSNPEAWEGKSPAAAQSSVPATAPRITATFTGLKPGAYAVRAFHDVNGDGQLNTNPFGIPTEPYAFSNNAHGLMGPAAWGDAMFTIGDGDNRRTIDIN